MADQSIVKRLADILADLEAEQGALGPTALPPRVKSVLEPLGPGCFSVYTLTRFGESAPFYVGLSRNIQARIYDHELAREGRASGGVLVTIEAVFRRHIDAERYERMLINHYPSLINVYKVEGA